MVFIMISINLKMHNYEYQILAKVLFKMTLEEEFDLKSLK